MIKAYASYFSAFLLTKINPSRISNIILFGSVARDEATEDSDIDIFIEVKKESKKLSREIGMVLEQFYKGKDALYFKAKGIDNKINLIIGKLSSYKTLRDSIESTGISLYGPYTSSHVKGKKHAIIFWESIGKNRGAFLNKLYGFNVGNKKYLGLIDNLNGQKIGKSCIMVPVQHREEVIKLIRHHEVNAKIIEVFK